MPLADRRAAPVTAAGGYAARESPDARFLYFTRVDVSGIWRQRASGEPGNPVRVVEKLAPEDWANWDVNAKGLYFRVPGTGGAPSSVALLPEGGSAPRRVAELELQAWPHFSVSRDGRSIVYPRADRHACDIRLIENP
jgi:hypothetical protein